MVQVRSQTQSNVNVFSASVNLLGLVRSELYLSVHQCYSQNAVLLRSPPPQAADFAHNGRSALYSFVCSVSGVRAPRIRFIRICALLNLRNMFRVAFLLSCHIFDCDGLSDPCLAGCPCRSLLATTLIFYNGLLSKSSIILNFFKSNQAQNLIYNACFLTANAILPL